MSFVAGFVAGVSTGEARERRKEGTHFREYMQHRGYSVIDRAGLTVPLDTIVDEALTIKPEHPNRDAIITGVVLVTAVVLTGGSAWALLAALA